MDNFRRNPIIKLQNIVPSKPSCLPQTSSLVPSIPTAPTPIHLNSPALKSNPHPRLSYSSDSSLDSDSESEETEAHPPGGYNLSPQEQSDDGSEQLGDENPSPGLPEEFEEPTPISEPGPSPAPLSIPTPPPPACRLPHREVWSFSPPSHLPQPLIPLTQPKAKSKGYLTPEERIILGNGNPIVWKFNSMEIRSPPPEVQHIQQV